MSAELAFRHSRTPIGLRSVAVGLQPEYLAVDICLGAADTTLHRRAAFTQCRRSELSRLIGRAVHNVHYVNISVRAVGRARGISSAESPWLVHRTLLRKLCSAHFVLA